MLTVTGIAAQTPIPQIQAEAQLSALREIFLQRRYSRLLEHGLVQEAASLAVYKIQPPNTM